MFDWFTFLFFTAAGAMPAAVMYGVYRAVGRFRCGPRRTRDHAGRHAQTTEEKPRITLR